MKYQVSTDAWACKNLGGGGVKKKKKAKEKEDFHTSNVKHLVRVVGL